MVSQKGPRKKYDREFILHAVRLVIEDKRKVHEVAQSLGVNHHMLYRWKEAFEKDPLNAFPGKGHLKPHEEEIRRMKREMYKIKQENEILKKAVAIFSKKPQ